MDKEKPIILVLGNEGSGLSKGVLENACTDLVRIDQCEHHGEDECSGGVDSLNVGVAAGILMSKFTQTMKKQTL